MEEQIENGATAASSNLLDLAPVADELGEIKELLEGLQPTEEQILAEQEQKALEEEQEQKAMERQVQLTAEQFETELETLRSINDNLLTLESAITDQNVLIEEQTAKNFEGSFIVVLALVITVAVYMFWNQLTKW